MGLRARMTPSRLAEITARFAGLRVAVAGDFSLDRYFDIDPARAETSIETGLPVHNITRVRCSPGAAGNIVQNLGALGAGTIRPVGCCGDDGEGFELLRALRRVPGVHLDDFLQSADRVTFTYTKPLIHTPGRAPAELSRLDRKNWTPTPPGVDAALCAALEKIAPQLDALIVMDQSATPGTGIISPAVLATLQRLAAAHPSLLVLADSRHGLGHFPPFTFKMNAAEFALLTHGPAEATVDEIKNRAAQFAATNQRAIFITLAERGIVGALPGEPAQHAPAFPLRGEIDIVGAGDTVTATLTLALAAGATVPEALQLAQAAANVVIHQLGTTGTATPADLRPLLCS